MIVPKCRLCGAGPTSSATPWGGSVVHACFGPGCVLAGVWFRPDQWRALMAPPVVTDEMVERATSGIYTLWWDYNEAKISRETLARAVLEAALKCDAVAAGRDFEECRDRYDTLMSDYAAVKAERDELARAVLQSVVVPNGRSRWCNGCGCFAVDGAAFHHNAPGCPVALAERIVKEAGDGR